MIHHAILAASALLLASDSNARAQVPPFHFVPGAVPLDRGPDGNSLFLDAPRGLILVDTGRHPAHAAALLAHARSRGRPIAAIINTHWHLDHTTGNLDVRQAYPEAHVFATGAIAGALAGFLKQSRARTAQRLSDPGISAEERAQLLRGAYRIDNPDTLRPTISVRRSGRLSVAGRPLDIHVAPFAATEADLWIYDPAERLAIVGDLVVDIVPFMDTACPDGWLKALDAIAATRFVTLIPGHGAPMSRSQFQQWKAAFERFVACGRSSRPGEECVAGWKRDASVFIAASHDDYVTQAATYYLETRLRSSPAEQQRYCR